MKYTLVSLNTLNSENRVSNSRIFDSLELTPYSKHKTHDTLSDIVENMQS